MKKVMILLLTIMSITVVINSRAAQPLNQIIAIVNGQPVTAYQFNMFADRAIGRLKATGQTLPNMQQFHQYLLNQYINRLLQLQIAKRANITVTAAQVEKHIASLASQQKMTPAQFTQSALAQGYSAAQFHDEVKTEMIIGLLQRQALGAHITVSQAEIKAGMANIKNNPQFASAYDVVDYLVPLQPGATAAQIAAAVKTSQGTDLGWRPLAALPDMFASVVPTLKVGGLSGLIKAPNGYHVLQLKGIKSAMPAGMTPEQAVAQQIYMQKVQKALVAWQATLRKQAVVQLNP